MKSRYYNLSLIIKDSYSAWIGVFFAIMIGIVIEYFSDRALISGNFGSVYAIISLISDSINVILVGLFVGSFVYKRKLFGNPNQNNQSGWLGSMTSILVSGCPTCSITLASYLGLASFFALLPYHGLEIKIAGTFILIWSVYRNIKDLTICRRKS